MCELRSTYANPNLDVFLKRSRSGMVIRGTTNICKEAAEYL